MKKKEPNQKENNAMNNNEPENKEQEENVSLEDHASPIDESIQEEKPVDELEKINQELADIKDKYLRTYAEFDNFRKRAAKERLELMKLAGQEVIISMLSVMDDFERAIKQMQSPQDMEAVKEGIVLIHNKFKTALEQRGVKAIESVGKEFNSELHEAITEVTAASEEWKGKIVEEIEKGYCMNDKIIRYAKVIVGK